MIKNILLLITCMFLLSFTANEDILKKIFNFPNDLKEISAVEVTSKSKWIWTLEDSGNKAELYATNAHGKIVNRLKINDAVNNDWEDLTSDPHGNLYIGDFGNNKNSRRDLCIYMINASHLHQAETNADYKISFYFPEQTEFPPKKTGRYYDVEAFFVLDGNFYLFTKNRSTTSDGETFLYTVPNLPGNHAAKLKGTFKGCRDFHSCAITSADLSPNGKKMVLLSYGHIWLFSHFENDDFFGGKVQQIDLPNDSDKEGICFVGNNRIFITDERNNGRGGNLYQLKLSKLKSKS